MSAPSPIWLGYSGSLVETAQSGTLKFAERVTLTQQFAGKYEDCMTAAALYPRASTHTITLPGIVGANVFIVDDATAVRDSRKGDVGTLTINFTALFTAPPPEFACVPFENNEPIEYNSFFYPTLTQADLQIARTIYNAATASGQTTAENQAATGVNGELILSLVNKWLQGKQTFYLAGQKITFTQYSAVEFAPLNQGGIIQSPIGIIPGSFTGAIPSGLSFLRQADEQCWANGLWKFTQSWLGAPAEPGWDTDLYPT